MTVALPAVASASDLFVFAGAGASCASPAGLPLFNPMRDAILKQLGLDDYVMPPDHRGNPTGPARITNGLAPEPFFLALRTSGVNVQDWLIRTLGSGQPSPPRPNAVHAALAELAAAGAAVWTVNFDTLIEEVAGHPVRAVAWPADPAGRGVIFKPHGSLPGQLIVTADQVLRGLRADWQAALREAVRGRTVAFIGYSGRDLDFQPLWDDLLVESKEVVWFDRPDADEPTRRRRLLRRCAASGVLTLADSAADSDPSRDFVAWCQANALISVDNALASRLADKPAAREFPPLSLASVRAEAMIRGLLGDWRGAMRVYRHMLRHEPDRRRTAGDIFMQIVNNGGRPVTAVLWAAANIPVLSREQRTVAERKRLTVHSRLGNHRQVLRGTRKIAAGTVSTLLILRAESLRITGSLDDAAEIAAEAYRRAREETHAVRVAHAAFQRALALLWAERIPECRKCLDEQLRPAAGIAAARWVAWADFIAGGVALRESDLRAAERFYELSNLRFRGEGLMDGVVSVQTAWLTMWRLTDPDKFEDALSQLGESMRTTAATETYYSRGHRFTKEAVLIERAEFARVHTHDLDLAARQYGEVARSRFPLQRSLGLLGLGLIAVESGTDRAALYEARDVAKRIGARLGVRHASEALSMPDGSRPDEVFFC